MGETSAGVKHVRDDLTFIKLGVINTQTYSAALQDLIIGAKSQLGTGLGELPQTSDGEVLLVQLFGCNQSLRLGTQCEN